MIAAGLVHGQSKFPVSLTLITAFILLLVGIAAIVSMLFPGGTIWMISRPADPTFH